MTRTTPDENLEAQVAEVVSGKHEAWSQLWESLEPRLAAIVAKPRFMGRLSANEDDQRNIVLEVMARLCADNYRRLHLYVAKRVNSPGMHFMPWLIVVAKRVAIDYMRAHDEYITHRSNGERGSAVGEWVERGELPSNSRLGKRPPMTEQGTALQMMSYAGHTLPEDQREALRMWVQSDAYSNIAEVLGLETSGQAEKLVRAALQRLRRHFREDGDKDRQ